MPKDTLTFEIGGDVDIDALESGFSAFRRLVQALTPRSAQVTWLVEDLHGGSATATLRGQAENLSIVERIVEEFGNVGSVLQTDQPLDQLPHFVSKAAQAVRTTTEKAEYVRLATPDGEFILSSATRDRNRSTSLAAVGAIVGRIQSLSNRGGLRFNLYDAIFDKAVVCYLEDGQEDRMREIWGRRARVVGTVYREPINARPVSIRRIVNIELMPDVERGAFRQARGAQPWKPEYESGDEVIRSLRDA